MTERQAVQSDKFEDAACEAECEEDGARWSERSKKVVKQGPKSEPGGL